MLELLSKKQRFPLDMRNNKIPVSGISKQLTISEKNEFYSYTDEYTGETVTIKRSIRTESRERITVVREQRRYR